MEAESVPVNKLDSKISKSSVKITVLGQIKSQLSTLKSALVELQTPANFSKQAAKFSNASVATADITATAASGSYQLQVSKLAQPAIWNVSGFADEITALQWYSTMFESAATKPQPTVFRNDTTYVLSLTSTSDENLIGESGSVPPEKLKPETFEYSSQIISYYKHQNATNAEFTLNGVDFIRPTNKVTDALTGVTLNLTTLATDPITLTVSNEQVSARPKLDALVKAYNDLYSLYKEQTASSIDVATRGILNSDFAVASVMRHLVSGLMLPMTQIGGSTYDVGEQTDLSAMGLKLLDNGKLAVDDALYAAASDTLQTRLSAGIRIGYNSDTKSDLSSQISDMLFSGGVIQDRIDSEKTTQSDLNKRKTDLQEKLIGVQARYTAQYASLDALLFKLQGTSDSLKSALDGLTNSQNNN